MELLADRDPEEARKLLDPVLERMMEAVHRYEGTVNQVMGDGIMALFGAPLAHEDHAVRACYAALRMQESVTKYAEEVRRSHAAVVKIRVGLNSGEVVVRAIGSDLHMDYTAVGQTTHLASRMEQLADPGAIVITPETLALAEGYVEVKSLGPVPVKGLAHAMEVYEVTAAGQARTRLQATARRGLTQFVGRDAELEQLRRAQQLAGNGYGQVVAVVGEAGVGKSRLVYEFIHTHRLQGWLVVEAASVSYSKATPYLTVLDLLSAYFQIESRDAARRTREKVSGKLVTLDEALLPMLPVFLALLGSADDPHWQSLDPPQRRHRTLESVKRLLFRESQVQPLVLVVEDLHWIDSETQAVLDSLVESLPTARVLLLVNYRPEYQDGWIRKTYYHQFRLDPLPPEGAQEVLDALLGRDPGLVRLKELLIERTQGNPFFLEESVRTLVETKAFVGERGAYSLARPVDAIRVPETVHAILAARIDRMPPREKRLLQSAAVIGHEVPFALLQAIAELADEDLQRGLVRLQAADFLYETRLFPELEYTFRHALTHEVAYGSVLHEHRRTLHAKVVAAIETLDSERFEHAETLAHHAVCAEAWEKAVVYLRLAGTKALARSANREATLFLSRATDALSHLPPSRVTLEQAFDVRLEIRTCLIRLGEFSRIGAELREAEHLAQALGDRRRSGRVLADLSDHCWILGEHGRAIEHGERALEIATALGDVRLEAEANFCLGQSYHAIGDYPLAMALLDKSLEAATRPSSPSAQPARLPQERVHWTDRLLQTYARTWLVWCLADGGRFSDGRLKGEEALRTAESEPEAWPLLHLYFCLGFLSLEQGDARRAIALLERGLEHCHTGDLPFGFLMIGACLGAAYTLAGQNERGFELLHEAVERASSMSFAAMRARWLTWLGEAHLRFGQIEKANELATRALDLARRHQERGNEGWAHALLGAAAELLDVGRAETHYRDALTMASALGMRPLIAHCHLGLAKLHRRTGKREQAQQHLTTATTMYREMGMTYWLEQAAAVPIDAC